MPAPTPNDDADHVELAMPEADANLNKPPVPAVGESAPTYMVYGVLNASWPTAATPRCVPITYPVLPDGGIPAVWKNTAELADGHGIVVELAQIRLTNAGPVARGYTCEPYSVLKPKTSPAGRAPPNEPTNVPS